MAARSQSGRVRSRPGVTFPAPGDGRERGAFRRARPLFLIILLAVSAGRGFGQALPLYSRDGKIVVQSAMAQRNYRAPVLVFTDQVRQGLARTTGLTFSPQNGLLEVAIGSQTNRETAVRTRRYRDAVSGALKERIELPDPEGADLDRFRAAICDALLNLWMADHDPDPATPPATLPGWLAVGLARYANRENRQKYLDRTLRLWSNACLPAAPLLWSADSPAALKEPSVAVTLSGWVLTQRHAETRDQTRSPLEQLLRKVAAGTAWSPDLVARILTGSPDLTGFDRWVDRQMLAEARTVAVPGMTTAGIARRFRSSLLLYPPVSAIFNDSFPEEMSFQQLALRANDPFFRSLALRQVQIVRLAAVGRDGTLLAVANAYEAFLLAVAKGAKPGEISRLLLVAEAKRGEMEEALAQEGTLRVPPAAH
ncbi:MAG: hypothetical protein J6334_02960 [Kiritimatiellae bacterium]|nr:hypothetical protein [Kiritimatiellia bacterium]